MVYKNIEIHNASELIDLGDGVTWQRFPGDVCDKLEKDTEQVFCRDTTGVELRFVMKSDEVTIKMASIDAPEDGVTCTFHVYYGSIQGGCNHHENHRIITNTPTDFVIKKSKKRDILKRMDNEFDYPFDCDVVRVIFDRGHIKIMDVIGEVEPPKKEQLPEKTILNYGSSITHGSNSIDMSHSWSYTLAHNLRVDCKNLGMASSCAMEPEVVDYIASEGKKDNWHIATLELGINVLAWDDDKKRERATYAIKTIAEANPAKPIIVISPFYCQNDYEGHNDAQSWRRILSEVTGELCLSNVYYKSGLAFIDNMSYISADAVHPNIYGVQRIADKLTEFINDNIKF